MLHAELHGKISPDADDAERREDVLTSTVFDTLFVAGAWEVLAAWLRRSQPVGAAPPVQCEDSAERAYWFWPRLHDAEPDLVIRIGANLFVIESKYLSGKSGVGAGTTTKDDQHVDREGIGDQLVREWKACSATADMGAYPAQLREAIHSCRLSLVYLVRRLRWGRELEAVAMSAKLIHSARMYLLTWEDLDQVLATHDASWVDDLRRYLYRRGLAAFRGFGHAIRIGEALGIGAWRLRAPAAVGVVAALAGVDLARLGRLASRQARTVAARTAVWSAITSPEGLARLSSLSVRPLRLAIEEKRHG